MQFNLVGRGIKLKTVHWALGVTQAFLRLFFLRFSFFSLRWLRLNNVSSHLSYFTAGPTIAVICAVEHRHPATHAHIAHNRQTLCRPRLQKPDLPASIATNGTAVQAEPLPDYTTATNADADAGVESHIPLDPGHAPSSLPSASSSSRLPKAKTTTTPGHSSQHISLTPNGIKAGVAGGDAYNILRDHIGWWYDWSADPSKPGEPIAAPMLGLC